MRMGNGVTCVVATALALPACSGDAADQDVPVLRVGAEIDIPSDDMYFTIYMLDAADGGAIQPGMAIFFCPNLAAEFTQWHESGGTVSGFDLSWGEPLDADGPSMAFIVDGDEVIVTIGMDQLSNGQECIARVDFESDALKNRLAPWLP